ncbi:MAG: PIN domain nuclease [Rhodospirillales bacterium]|nr:PIN domain nuclease [Rhodospirillales bacterium]
MIVVDSSVWIDFLNGVRSAEVERLLPLLGRQPLLVGDIILLEVLQGIRNEAEATRVEAGLRRFLVEPMLDAELAVVAARHYRRLRTAGITVRKTIDLVIGTFCIVRGHPLLTSDRDFRPMAEHLGLRLA